MRRIALATTTGALLALLAILVASRHQGPEALHGTLLEPPMPPRELGLGTPAGTLELADLRGQLVALFFGYTHCPDVCPVTLARFDRALDLLGPADRDRVRFVFVSVDPERDDPATVARYAAAFGPEFIGAAGSPEEIAAVAAAYGVYHAKSESEPTAAGYLIDHTASVFLLDGEGRGRLLWSFEATAEEIASDLRWFLTADD